MPEKKDPLSPPASLSPSPEAAELREKLSKLRNAIFQLHKALIDSERITYEQTMGSIPSPGYFLQLLTNDPWFAWLHPFSQLIVALDVAIDSKEPLTAATVDVLVRQTITILTPSETGEGFARHYFDALQRDPDVVFAHVIASRLVRPTKPAA